MKLWISIRSRLDGAIAPPSVCPHAGCDGRRFRVHQHVAKSVRTADGSGRRRDVRGRRYRCLRCGHRFRVYPQGIDHGRTAVAVKRLAAALCFLGLSIRDASAVLAMLGMPLGKSQVHASVRRMVGGLNHRRLTKVFGRLWPAEPEMSSLAAPGVACMPDGREMPHAPRACITVHDRRLPLFVTTDDDGNPALVIDGLDTRTAADVDRWIRATLGAIGVAVKVEWPRERREAGCESVGPRVDDVDAPCESGDSAIDAASVTADDEGRVVVVGGVEPRAARAEVRRAMVVEGAGRRWRERGTPFPQPLPPQAGAGEHGLVLRAVDVWGWRGEGGVCVGAIVVSAWAARPDGSTLER